MFVKFPDWVDRGFKNFMKYLIFEIGQFLHLDNTPARKRCGWDSWVQVPTVAVLCSVQRVDADEDTAGGDAHAAGQQQECTPATNRTDGGA